MTEKNVQADLELKKAFAELQAKAVDTKMKIKMANVQIETLKREKVRAELTQYEISAISQSSNTRMYESIGRLFIYKDTDTIKKHLQERQDTANEKIKNLETSKTILDRSVKDCENNLRELIQQWKSKVDD